MKESTESAFGGRALIWTAPLVLAIGAIGALWWILSQDAQQGEVAVGVSSGSPETIRGNRPVDVKGEASTVEAAAAESGAEDAALSIKSQEWYRDRGYYLDLSGQTGILQPTHPYQAYDNQTLEELMKGGDMVAAAIFGDRLLTTTDSDLREEGLSAHKEAVLLGATYSAIVLGGEDLHRGVSGDAKKDVDKLRDGLAWYVFASQRGDAAANYNYQQYINSRNISPALVGAACDRAEALRAELEAERDSRGLGEFDDSPFPQLEELRNQGVDTEEPCK